MKLYASTSIRGYDPMHTNKIKQWIAHHYEYLNKKHRKLSSYSDHQKYNMLIQSRKSFILVIKRFHDSKTPSDKFWTESRIWTRARSIRKPVVKWIRRSKKVMVSPCVKIKRIKYKLGTRFYRMK